MTPAEKAVALAKAKREAARIVRSRAWTWRDKDYTDRWREVVRLAHAIKDVADEMRPAALEELRRMFPVHDHVERGWLLDWALADVAAGAPVPPPAPGPLDGYSPKVRRALIAVGCGDLETS